MRIFILVFLSIIYYMKIITQMLELIEENKYLSLFITFFLVIFCSLCKTELPRFIRKLFDNFLFKIGIVTLILLKTKSNPQLGLILGITYIIVSTMIRNREFFGEISFELENDSNAQTYEENYVLPYREEFTVTENDIKNELVGINENKKILNVTNFKDEVRCTIKHTINDEDKLVCNKTAELLLKEFEKLEGKYLLKKKANKEYIKEVDDAVIANDYKENGLNIEIDLDEETGVFISGSLVVDEKFLEYEKQRNLEMIREQCEKHNLYVDDKLIHLYRNENGKLICK